MGQKGLKKKSKEKEKVNGLVNVKKQNRLGRITRRKEDKLFTFPLFNLRVSDNGEKQPVCLYCFKKIDKRAVVKNKTKEF